jgi:hypothetical protein
MLDGTVDHLWQSLQFSGAACVLAWIARGHAAIVRLWLYRIAAFKFLVPFHLLFALGYWHGFPVAFSADAPPERIVEAVFAAMPWFTPARPTGWNWLLLPVAVAASVTLLRWMARRRQAEEVQEHAERMRLERDPDDRQPGLGFLKSALFTTLTLVTFALPLTGGAIHGSLHRREVLIANALALRAAPMIIRPAVSGMGGRFVIRAAPEGVLIRNATIRDLAALAYGVHPYFVRGNHFVASGQEDWLTNTRHDVFVTAGIVEPERFDSYALRQPLTKLLAEQFGLEIYVNGDCQPPCGRWGVALTPDPLSP